MKPSPILEPEEETLEEVMKFVRSEPHLLDAWLRGRPPGTELCVRFRRRTPPHAERTECWDLNKLGLGAELTPYLAASVIDANILEDSQ
jgi:hypothetical protein